MQYGKWVLYTCEIHIFYFHYSCVYDSSLFSPVSNICTYPLLHHWLIIVWIVLRNWIMWLRIMLMYLFVVRVLLYLYLHKPFGFHHIVNEPKRSCHKAWCKWTWKSCQKISYIILSFWCVSVTRRGPVRYKFEVLYPLDQVLPVNIKDRGNTKNAFKVLIFPDTRVFMAPTAKSKVSQ